MLAEIASILALPCRTSTIPVGPGDAPPIIAELRHGSGLEHSARRTFSAMSDPDVVSWATSAGDGPLILSGIAMEGAVLATALEALEHRLPVQVVLDACAGLSHRTENAAIRQIEAAGGLTTSIPTLIAAAGIELGSLQGQKIMGSLRGLLAS